MFGEQPFMVSLKSRTRSKNTQNPCFGPIAACTTSQQNDCSHRFLEYAIRKSFFDDATTTHKKCRYSFSLTWKMLEWKDNLVQLVFSDSNCVDVRVEFRTMTPHSSSWMKGCPKFQNRYDTNPQDSRLPTTCADFNLFLVVVLTPRSVSTNLAFCSYSNCANKKKLLQNLWIGCRLRLANSVRVARTLAEDVGALLPQSNIAGLWHAHSETDAKNLGSQSTLEFETCVFQWRAGYSTENWELSSTGTYVRLSDRISKGALEADVRNSVRRHAHFNPDGMLLMHETLGSGVPLAVCTRGDTANPPIQNSYLLHSPEWNSISKGTLCWKRQCLSLCAHYTWVHATVALHTKSYCNKFMSLGEGSRDRKRNCQSSSRR